MNEHKSQSTDAAGGTAALEARIERMRQTMTAQQARLARGSMLTAVIGAVLCVGMAIWFSIGYGMVRDMTTPKMLVDAAESVVMRSLPDARQALEREINDSADEWAANISRQVRDNIPSVRSKLEDLVVAKADEAFDKVQIVTADQFRAFVIENHGMLNDGFSSLKNTDEAKKFEQDLHKVVEAQLARDMRQQSDDMLHMIYDLNAKLEILKTGQKLNGEQALEREILMIAKRLQEDTQDDRPMKVSKKSTPRAGEEEPDAVASSDEGADNAGAGSTE